MDPVDISAFCLGGDGGVGDSAWEKDRVAKLLVSQLSDIGFALIVGHGISPVDIEEAFNVSQEFFHQPLNVKTCATSKDKARRGYSSYQSENFASLAGEQKPNDLVEKFRIGPVGIPEGREHDPYYTCKEGRVHFFPNTWTSTPDGMEAVLRRYYQQMEQLALRLLQIIELGLGIPLGSFQMKMDRHTSILGLNFFPELRWDAATPNQPFRIAEHTDVSMLTIIAHRFGDGLEIRSKDGLWREIRPVKGGFLINIGDCLRDWTGGLLASTEHRVALTGAVLSSTDEKKTLRDASFCCPERYSIAYFVSPDHNAQMAFNELDLTVSDSRCDSLVPGVSYSEWRRCRIKEALKSLRR